MSSPVPDSGSHQGNDNEEKHGGYLIFHLSRTMSPGPIALHFNRVGVQEGAP